ncbi:AfsR/SARP family transcriptional regulator [Kitasatospora sp. NPDC001539]|uniref:AfsR/SARP family transcriptional regulator n=1 Tax=unclassified Kitasatospora TaxID=2633591 RepID=UPI00332433FF
MEIGILGPLTARLGRTSVVPSAGKPRQVLALLALRSGTKVPVETLFHELWSYDPPRSAATTLQTYILQLRRMLAKGLAPEGTCPKTLLRTQYNGYLLDVPVEQTDAARFDRLREAGQAALRAGDCATAAIQLRAALDLWRGPAMADLQLGEILSIEAVQLEENRLCAVDDRISADLGLGRHASLIGELASLTARHPMHQNLHAHYMLALYRCGRASNALDVYRRLHGTLVESIGLEPSPKLQRLHHAMLNADPQLDVVQREPDLARL